MEFFDEDDEEEELQRNLSQESVERSPPVFAVKSCLASDLRIVAKNIRVGVKLGFLALMDFALFQVDKGRFGQKLDPEVRRKAMRVLSRMMHYVEAHSFRSAFNIDIQAQSDCAGDKKGPQGLTLEISGRPGPVTMVPTPCVSCGDHLEGSGKQKWKSIEEAIRIVEAAGYKLGEDCCHIQHSDGVCYFYESGTSNGISGKETWSSMPVKQGWTEEVLSYHNEINLMDALSDIGKVQEFQAQKYKDARDHHI